MTVAKLGSSRSHDRGERQYATAYGEHFVGGLAQIGLGVVGFAAMVRWRGVSGQHGTILRPGAKVTSVGYTVIRLRGLVARAVASSAVARSAVVDRP